MADDTEPHGPREWLRLLRPTRSPASTIYGTIVAAALVAAESDGDLSVAAIVGSVLVAQLVYWLAHAYSDLLAPAPPDQHTERPDHPSLAAVVRSLGEEWGIVAGGLGLVVVLVIADLAGAGRDLAVYLALGCAVAELGGWGVLAARRAELKGIWLVVYPAVSAIFGALVIVLKVVLA